MLLYLWKRRAVHTGHFMLLYGGSERIYKDLNGLHHNGYAQRLPAQVPLQAWMRHLREGSLPRVYTLDNQGADELSRWYGLPRGNTNWREKNRTLTPWRLPHRLRITSAMVPFDLSARRGEIRLIEPGPAQSLSPEPACSWRSPFRLEATVEEENGGRIPVFVITDNTFSVTLRDRDDEPKLLFLEADRGSEPDQRSGGILGEQSDIARKIIGYSAYAEEGRSLEQFGLRNFRVLFPTTSQRRMMNLIALAQSLTSRGLGRFLFTDEATLKSSSEDILNLPWVNARGEEVRLRD